MITHFALLMSLLSPEFLIRAEAVHQGLNPDIAVAVARIESALNPHARGKKGEIGLFQLQPAYVPYTRQQLLNPRINAKEGVKQLLYYRVHCPSQVGNTWITCFNQGQNRKPVHPELLPYYKKFEGAMK